jgi:hypothetical protein
MDNNNITVVTAFIKINKNKYNSNYEEWISNLLLHLNKNLVIFTSPDYYNFIKNLRKDYQDKTLIITVSKMEELYMYNYINYLKKDYERDHEKAYQNTDLYLIWNEKFKFLEKAINLNPFKTTYFAWCDIGYVRNKDYIYLYMKEFPNIKKLTEDKIYMNNIDYNFTDDDFLDPYNNKYRFIPNSIGAGFVIGRDENLRKMIDIYYNQVLPFFVKNDYFIGKEQNLMVCMYLANPSLFKLIRGSNDKSFVPFCEFKWFYFLKYLS